MTRFNPFYDQKLIVKYGFMMVAFFMACKLSRSLFYPAIIPLALYHYSMKRFEDLHFIVLVALASIVTSGWFVPQPMIFAVSQRGLLMMLGVLLAMSVAGRRTVPQIGPLRAFMLYVVYMVFVSLQGWSPVISGLKMFLFFSIFVGFYATTIAVSQQPHGMRKMRSLILAVVSFFVIGSVLTIPFPGISQMGYDAILASGGEMPVSLFCGVTKHSQTLGPVIAICCVLVFGDLAFSIQRWDRLYVILLLAAPYLIYKTSSRTAMGGMMAGIFFVFWCVSTARAVKPNWKSRLVQSGLLLGALGCMAILIVPSMRASILRFAVKYGDHGAQTVVSTETILSSRQHKLDNAIRNWKQSPIFGNGFQVSEDMQGFEVTGLKSIISAPVEKSTWVYAILEEGGVVGEILFCLIAFYITATLMRHRAYIGASCFFTMLVLNLGEFCMFSLSGVGGFIWGMVFAGCAMDARRERERRAVAFMPGRPRFF